MWRASLHRTAAGRAIADGYQLLQELGAVEEQGGVNRLTPLGKQLARLPLDRAWAA
jgi:ATP-dependent helicase HrpA